MNQQLEGKVAIVSGGASGIGRAAVMRLLADGATVVSVDLDDEAGAELVAHAQEKGLKALCVVSGDVSREEDVSGFVQETVRRFGHLDIIVNNAGIGGGQRLPVTDIDVEDWDRLFAVLCRGVFLGTKHAARVMQDTGRGGSIINMGSISGLSGGPWSLPYGAAKAAVISFTRAAAPTLFLHRIRVNIICPGPIDTPGRAASRRDRGIVDVAITDEVVWPPVGTPEDIAATVAWLGSDESRHITGANIVVDGGISAGGGPISFSV